MTNENCKTSIFCAKQPRPRRCFHEQNQYIKFLWYSRISAFIIFPRMYSSPHRVHKVHPHICVLPRGFCSHYYYFIIYYDRTNETRASKTILQENAECHLSINTICIKNTTRSDDGWMTKEIFIAKIIFISKCASVWRMKRETDGTGQGKKRRKFI